MSKPLTTSSAYKALVSKIVKEFSELEFFLKRRIALGHWNVGRYIHEHLLAHQKRAKHGTAFYEQLAEDTGRDVSTLQRTVQFYLAYPIPAERRELTWNHYKSLITVKDARERKKLEEKIIRNHWNVEKLQKYLSLKRKLAAPDNGDKPVPQLAFTRGRLHTYQIVKANKPLIEKSSLVLDLGFRQQHLLPKDTPRLQEGDVVELVFKEEELCGATKIEISKDELFTYQAYVDKVIDADTLITSFDFHLEVSLSQKLRLREIDCPEIATEEGKRAKRFVESRLKGCEFIVVKTYKDRSDKFDRYLADIFYKAGVSDPAIVAREGKFLNQELLDEGLARPWPE